MVRLVLLTGLVFYTAVSVFDFRRSACWSQEQGQESSSAQIQQWITQLNSDLYHERESASQQLIAAGRKAVDSLCAAALSSEMEVSWRATQVLQEIGIGGDFDTMEYVLGKLQQLSRQGRPELSGINSQLHVRWKQARHDRAVARIRSLGGQVTDSSSYAAEDLFGGRVLGGGLRPLDFAPEPVIEVTPLAIPHVDGPEGVKDEKQRAERELEERLKALIRELESGPTPTGESPPLQPQRTPSSDKSANLTPTPPSVVQAAPSPRRDPPARVKREDALVVDEAQEKRADDDEEAAARELAEAVRRIEEVRDVGGMAAPVVVVDEFPIVIDGGLELFATPANSVSSTTVVLDQRWRGTLDDFRSLADLNNLILLQLTDFELEPQTIIEIAKLESLKQLKLTNARYKLSHVVALMKARPDLRIEATGPAYLGVSGDLNATQGEGCRVVQVLENSGAHQAGLQVNDLLVSVNGHEIRNFAMLAAAIANKEVGQVVRLQMKRDGKLIEADAKLGSRDQIQ